MVRKVGIEPTTHNQHQWTDAWIEVKCLCFNSFFDSSRTKYLSHKAYSDFAIKFEELLSFKKVENTIYWWKINFIFSKTLQLKSNSFWSIIGIGLVKLSLHIRFPHAFFALHCNFFITYNFAQSSYKKLQRNAENACGNRMCKCALMLSLFQVKRVGHLANVNWNFV